MKALRWKWCISALFGVSLMGSASFADSVSLDYQPSIYSSGDGGEFKATLSGSLAAEVVPQSTLVEAYGTPSSTNQVIFQTFCIQAGVNDVFFNPGVSYTPSIVTVNQDPNPNSVVAGVSYLFDQFWKGMLSNYNYATSGTNSAGLTRSTSAGALQAVIWTLEGDEDVTASPGQGLPPLTLTDALAQLPYAYYSSSDDQSGIYGNADAINQAETWLKSVFDLNTGLIDVAAVPKVKILDMADGSNPPGFHQAQLVEAVPLPASASLGFSMLAGFGGLLAVRKWRRRDRQIV